MKLNNKIAEKLQTKLRQELSMNNSGTILNEHKIELLEEKNYYVKDWSLEGDAPKQFIKAYFFEKNSNVRRKNLNTWFPYISKCAEKWYPHESIVEYMINRIGQELGIKMNEIKLVKANGQIRFLSRYFLNQNEMLIHGAQICGEYLEDMEFADEVAKHKKTARDLFTYEFIKEAIKSVFPNCHEEILEGLVRMITYDAIVGNNDRHFYNWGVIDSEKRTRKKPKFSPVYDTARGLLWNFSDQNIVNLHNKVENRIDKYIEEASPRISLESNNQANHFDLIQFIKKDNARFKAIIKELSNSDNESRVIKMLEKECFPFFIKERCQLLETILKKRFNKIRSV